MGHPTQSDKGLEGVCNKLRAVVRDDTRCSLRELLSSDTKDDDTPGRGAIEHK